MLAQTDLLVLQGETDMIQRSGKVTVSMLCALLLLNTACTTTRAIDVDERSTYAQHIEPGDRVRLLYLDEQVREIRVVEVNDREIIGKLETGGVVIADWRDIYAAERVEISPVRTAGAAVGIVVAVPVLALMALMSGCATTYC